MNKKFDEITLSAYLDGELDTETMKEVEVYLKSSPEGREYIEKTVQNTSLLKATLNEVLDEKVPQRLVDSIDNQQSAWSWLTGIFWQPALGVALSILSLVVGFGSGVFWQKHNKLSAIPNIASAPEVYSQIIDAALEGKVSGDSVEVIRDGLKVTVVPVKTYTGQKGEYYREYLIELNQNEQSNTVKGLALRIGKKQWQTKALFFDKGVEI